MIDRLMNSIRELGAPIVVGLDPTPDIVPEVYFTDAAKSEGKTPGAAALALFRFNCEIIDAIADVIPAVKPNIAFYERYGLEGIRAYIKTTGYAMDKGLMVIGDIKRGDIGSTAAAYAGHLESAALFGEKFEIWSEDAVTLNPYLGEDSVKPFLDVMKNRDKGMFLLVKTSNPGSADIQDLLVCDPAVAGGGASGSRPLYEHSGTTERRPLYEHVADLVSKWGEAEGLMGELGYSKVGAVVGATHPETGARLRDLMPHTFFLVPGYGAQGAGAKDVRRFFNAGGRGSIVNSSRGIIGAWKADGKGTAGSTGTVGVAGTTGAAGVGEAARAAAIRMRDELGAVL